jgi:hypothetical protein
MQGKQRAKEFCRRVGLKIRGWTLDARDPETFQKKIKSKSDGADCQNYVWSSSQLTTKCSVAPSHKSCANLQRSRTLDSFASSPLLLAGSAYVANF